MALSTDGRQFPKRDPLLKGCATLNVAEVKAEWQAQIEKFIRATGQRPTHLDSHHHSSYFTPALFAAMLELADQYQCAIRYPLTTQTGLLSGLSPEEEGAARAFLQNGLATMPHVRRPDYFETQFYGAGATPETLSNIVANLREGVTEIMCHPGLPDPGLAALTIYNAERAMELGILTDEGIKNQIQHAGIELISFRALA
jgi:hypothetical protein